MSILETIKSRRSIRDFTDREIPGETIEALIEAVRWAPSAGNLQSRKFYFVLNRETKKKLAQAAFNQHFIAEAPLVAVACLDRRIAARYGERGVNLYGIQDVAASVENMMLTAHELGLGSVWVGAFNEHDVAEIMELPDNLRPVAIVPVGYPARTPAAPPRASKDDVITFIR